VSYWTRLVRRGWPLTAEGPFEELWRAQGRAENRLVAEPLDIRPETASEVFTLEPDGSERRVWAVRWVDQALAGARNPKWGFVRWAEGDLPW